MRKPFYEIRPKAYLFPHQVSEATEQRRNHEEPVRQWCAYELIRAYGIPIGNLEFERTVRVGSKQYRIDVLVSKDGRPWLVVECKRQEDGRHGAASEQAMSYANADEIRAEFIVSTNGREWRVSRRIGGNWLPVVDLPHWDEVEAEGSVVELLQAVKYAQPLLLILEQDRPVKGAGREFFNSLREFFMGGDLMTSTLNSYLQHGFEFALRSVIDPALHRDYRLDKLRAAANQFEAFRVAVGGERTLPPVGLSGNIAEELHALALGVDVLLELAKRSSGEEFLALRLMSSVLSFARQIELNPKASSTIPIGVHRCLRDYLEHVFLVHFSARLPDAADTIGMADMRRLCDMEEEEG